MGPYDDNAEEYEFDQEVMDAHWLEHEESGCLYIVARPEDGFEGYGAEDDILEELYSLTEHDLQDEKTMSGLGFELIPDHLRRLDPEVGYYAA
jgi:hypothetical protein